ncbi:hypothetical protein N7467_004377 [Penicillium canescens]|nr:hypothetical protein N7467_004377 [Penicillium canescens]
MISQSRLFLALGALSSLALSEKVGYFDASACADSNGYTSCYKDADTVYTNCVNKNCAGGSQACSNSCGGSITCMNKQCPGLGRFTLARTRIPSEISLLTAPIPIMIPFHSGQHPTMPLIPVLATLERFERSSI